MAIYSKSYYDTPEKRFDDSEKVQRLTKEEKPSKEEIEASTKGILRMKGETAEDVERSIRWIKEDPILNRLLNYSHDKTKFLTEARKEWEQDAARHSQLTAALLHSSEYKMRPTIAKLLFGDKVIGDLRNLASKEVIVNEKDKIELTKKMTYFKEEKETLLEEVFVYILEEKAQKELENANRNLKQHCPKIEEIEKQLSIKNSPSMTPSKLRERLVNIREALKELEDEYNALINGSDILMQNEEGAEKKMMERLAVLSEIFLTIEKYDINDFVEAHLKKEEILHTLNGIVQLLEPLSSDYTKGICTGIVLDLIDALENKKMPLEDALKNHFKKGGTSLSAAYQSLIRNLGIGDLAAKEIKQAYTAELPHSDFNPKAIRSLIEAFETKYLGPESLEHFGKLYLKQYVKLHPDYNEVVRENDLQWAIACFKLVQAKRNTHLANSVLLKDKSLKIDPVTRMMMINYEKRLERRNKAAVTAYFSGLKVGETSAEMRMAELKNSLNGCLKALSTLSRGSYLVNFDTKYGGHAIMLKKNYDGDDGSLYIVDPNGFALKCNDTEDAANVLEKMINLYEEPMQNEGKRSLIFIKLHPKNAF